MSAFPKSQTTSVNNTKTEAVSGQFSAFPVERIFVSGPGKEVTLGKVRELMSLAFGPLLLLTRSVAFQRWAVYMPATGNQKQKEEVLGLAHCNEASG
jgi:hypothetical protein